MVQIVLCLVIAAALSGPLTAGGIDRDAAVARARRAVAEKEGLEPERLELGSAVEQTWPDASLGCPAKDAAYAQVVSRGWRVELRLGDARYDVRVGPASVVVCERRTPRAPAAEEIEAARRVGALARSDLAATTGVPFEKIRVVSVKRTTWPDAGLGCPAAGSTPPAAGATSAGPVHGFLVTVTDGTKTFTYHADVGHVVRCDRAHAP